MLHARLGGLRLRAALIALACVAGQAAIFAHRVLVEHVVCAEHGEAVHSTVDRRGNPELLSDQPGAIAIAASSPSHGHDHCPLFSIGRHVVTRGERACTTLEPDVDRRDPHAAAAPVRTGALSGYRLAPKTSPPATRA